MLSPLGRIEAVFAIRGPLLRIGEGMVIEALKRMLGCDLKWNGINAENRHSALIVIANIGFADPALFCACAGGSAAGAVVVVANAEDISTVAVAGKTEDAPLPLPRQGQGGGWLKRS